ncbi:MAG: M23 family metallopeptidase [Myxococcota bacterium]
MGRRFLLAAAVFACAPEPAPEPVPPAPLPPAPLQGPEPMRWDHSLIQVQQVQRNDSLSTVLARMNVGALGVEQVLDALAGLVDFTKVHPGDRLEGVVSDAGRLDWLRYVGGVEDRFVALRVNPEAMYGYQEHVPVRVERAHVQGVLEDSLYLSMKAIGEKDWLALTVADLFAWDIDFFTEPRRGDRFQMVVEKRYVEDAFVGYGSVLGAEYAQVDGDVFRAFRYAFEDGRAGYYQADGTAVEKQFLKSPVKFATITSRFGLRRHPVLKYVRAHKGVDYGAPRGTGIWAVGGGVVTWAARRGGYGRLVEVRHRNGLSTRYAHLSRYGPGIRKGTRVRQKQVIGYVGSSGMATGPHLHFEVLRQGRQTNPLTLVVPPAPPLPEAERPRFEAQVAPTIATLEGEGGVETETGTTTAALD